MLKIGNGLYVSLQNVNQARVYQKDNKWQICFTMKAGEPVFSDKFENEKDCLDILNS